MELLNSLQTDVKSRDSLMSTMNEEELAPESENLAQPLLSPRHPMPELVSTNEGLKEVIQTLRSGTGPIAIDAERASGYKYSQRAYLIQIFRRGGGLHLIDPIILRSGLNSAIASLTRNG